MYCGTGHFLNILRELAEKVESSSSQVQTIRKPEYFDQGSGFLRTCPLKPFRCRSQGLNLETSTWKACALHLSCCSPLESFLPQAFRKAIAVNAASPFQGFRNITALLVTKVQRRVPQRNAWTPHVKRKGEGTLPHLDHTGFLWNQGCSNKYLWRSHRLRCSCIHTVVGNRSQKSPGDTLQIQSKETWEKIFLYPLFISVNHFWPCCYVNVSQNGS